MNVNVFRGVFLTLSMLIASQAQAAPVTLTDVLGHKITLDTPVKRAVLGFYFEDYMAVGGDKAFDHLVGISREAWHGKVPANWDMYVKYRPSIADIPDIGEIDLHNVSLEKLISLKPDVVILASWQYAALKYEVTQLQALNIPVVVLDYNDQTVENHVKSTEIIGVLTGETQRAKELADLYKNNIALVQDRIIKANLPKPKVYIEFGNKGPAEYSFTYGENMWGVMLRLAGGENIAAPFIKQWGEINPEQLLVARPDVIFISGRENNKVDAALEMGIGVKESTARAKLQAFSHREGWETLPAIQNNRLYGVYQGASRTLVDFTMVQFIAKSLYPDLFADIDPVKNYHDYYKKYLPVSPTGTFAISASAANSK